MAIEAVLNSVPNPHQQPDSGKRKGTVRNSDHIPLLYLYLQIRTIKDRKDFRHAVPVVDTEEPRPRLLAGPATSLVSAVSIPPLSVQSTFRSFQRSQIAFRTSTCISNNVENRPPRKLKTAKSQPPRGCSASSQKRSDSTKKYTPRFGRAGNALSRGLRKNGAETKVTILPSVQSVSVRLKVMV